MKNKKILLINDNYPETVTIQKSLDQLNVQYTLHVAQNGKDALDILMGSSSTYMENYARTGKVQPDIILLNKSLSDMTSFEFLEIMRKYYSLKNIKVFLLTTSVTEVDRQFAERFAIAGYLERPFEINQNSFGSFNRLKSELSSSQINLAFMPLAEIKAKITGGLNLLKTKAMVLNLGHAAGVKIAACAVSAIMISGTVTYIGVGKSQVSQSFKRSEAIVEAGLKPSGEDIIAEEPVVMQEETTPKAERVEKDQAVKKPDVVRTSELKPDIAEKKSPAAPEVRPLTIKVVEDDEALPAKQ